MRQSTASPRAATNQECHPGASAMDRARHVVPSAPARRRAFSVRSHTSGSRCAQVSLAMRALHRAIHGRVSSRAVDVNATMGHVSNSALPNSSAARWIGPASPTSQRRHLEPGRCERGRNETSTSLREPSARAGPVRRFVPPHGIAQVLPQSLNGPAPAMRSNAFDILARRVSVHRALM